MCVEWVFLGGCWPSSPMKRVYHVVSGCHHSFQLYVLKEPCWRPVLQQGGSFNTMWCRAFEPCFSAGVFSLVPIPRFPWQTTPPVLCGHGGSLKGQSLSVCFLSSYLLVTDDFGRRRGQKLSQLGPILLAGQ